MYYLLNYVTCGNSKNWSYYFIALTILSNVYVYFYSSTKLTKILLRDIYINSIHVIHFYKKCPTQPKLFNICNWMHYSKTISTLGKNEKVLCELYIFSEKHF